MDPKIFKNIDADAPRFSESVTTGVTTMHMKLFVQEIDQTIRCAFESLPDNIEYIGCRPCTALEEYSVIADLNDANKKSKTGKSKIETSRSDVRLMRFNFRFNGKDLPPKYMYVVYVGRGGITHLWGRRLTILPVIADRVYSVTKKAKVSTDSQDCLYMPFLRDKCNFFKLPYDYKESKLGQTTTVNSYVVWSPIHKKANVTARGRNVKTSLVHYLFCKYGVTETFRKYLGTEVYVGVSEINEVNYPPDQYVICRSTGLSDRVGNNRNSQPTDLRMAVPIDKYTESMRSVICGFFYVTDNFSDSYQISDIDNPKTWWGPLGSVIFPDEANHGRLLNNISIHLDSISGYLDVKVKQNLSMIDVFSEDIYEFFFYLIENLPRIIQTTDVSDLYNKRYTVLRYVTDNFVTAAFTFMYEIKGILNSTTPGRRKVDEAVIKSALTRYFNRDLIFNLTSKPTLEMIGSPNDSILRFSGKAKLQPSATKTPGAKSGGETDKLSDPSLTAHVSVIEYGSIYNFPSPEPTGREKINPWGTVDDRGAFIRDEERREQLDEVQNRMYPNKRS